jgi:hypothetical protein
VITSEEKLVDGRWHHLAASWSPNAADLYLNGRRVARELESRELLQGALPELQVGGAQQDDETVSYTGDIDEFAVWDRALTKIEVEQPRRGSKATHSAAETSVIVGIWKYGKQPCGTRFKQTLPLWLDSYQARHGSLEASIHQEILSYSPHTLDRITAPHRSVGSGRLGRKTGCASNRINKFVPIRCGPQAFDELGWFEADTVSHGG